MAKRERSTAKDEASTQVEAPPQPPGVKLVRTLRGHTGWIGRIAWSPDGRTLASPSNDKTIRLWDVETGQCRRTLTGYCGPLPASNNVLLVVNVGTRLSAICSHPTEEDLVRAVEGMPC